MHQKGYRFSSCFPLPCFGGKKWKEEKNGKKEGREWTDRVLRKVEVLENLEFI